MSTVLITGAASGIGNLTAKALARAGHRVYATKGGPEGRNAPHARELRDCAAARGVDIRVVEPDVTSQESAEAAVETVSAEEIAHLIDVNTLPPSSAPTSSPRRRWTRSPWSPPTRSPGSASRP